MTAAMELGDVCQPGSRRRTLVGFTWSEARPYARLGVRLERVLRGPARRSRRPVRRQRRSGTARASHVQGEVGCPRGLWRARRVTGRACRREVREELSLDRPPLRLINVDWAPSDKEGDKLLFLFDRGVRGSDENNIQLDGVKLDRWQWVEAAKIEEYAIDRIVRRVQPTLSTPSSIHLENGLAVAHTPTFPKLAKPDATQ